MGLESGALVLVPRRLLCAWGAGGGHHLLGALLGVWALAWSLVSLPALLPAGSCEPPPSLLFLASLPYCKLGFLQSSWAGLGWDV